jgi:hypothetical protein
MSKIPHPHFLHDPKTWSGNCLFWLKKQKKTRRNNNHVQREMSKEIEDKGNNKKQHVEREMSKEKRRMRDVRRLVSSCGDCVWVCGCVCVCGAAVATKHPLFCVLILNCQPTSLFLSLLNSVQTGCGERSQDKHSRFLEHKIHSSRERLQSQKVVVVGHRSS